MKEQANMIMRYPSHNDSLNSVRLFISLISVLDVLMYLITATVNTLRPSTFINQYSGSVGRYSNEVK